jgi:hypothetical protein
VHCQAMPPAVAPARCRPGLIAPVSRFLSTSVCMEQLLDREGDGCRCHLQIPTTALRQPQLVNLTVPLLRR